MLRRRLGVGGNGEVGATAEIPAPGRLADQIAYDVALIRACEQLGIPQDLTGGGPVVAERRRVEQALAEAWPQGSGPDPYA